MPSNAERKGTIDVSADDKKIIIRDVDFTCIDESTLTALRQKFKGLSFEVARSISFVACRFDENSIKTALALLPQSNGLKFNTLLTENTDQQRKCIEKINNYLVNKQIPRLAIASTNLSESLDLISSLLSKYKKLSVLSLVEINLYNARYQEFSTFCTQLSNSKLSILDISGNTIPHELENATEYLMSLAEALKNSPALQIVEMSKTNLGTEFDDNYNEITTLPPETLDRVLQLIVANTQLRRLYMSQTGLSDLSSEQVSDLLESLPPQLSHLDLSGNYLCFNETNGADQLLQHLIERHTQLSALILSREETDLDDQKIRFNRWGPNSSPSSIFSMNIDTTTGSPNPRSPFSQPSTPTQQRDVNGPHPMTTTPPEQVAKPTASPPSSPQKPGV